MIQTEIFSIEIHFEEKEKINTIYSYSSDWAFIILVFIIFIPMLFPNNYMLLKNKINNKLLFLKNIKIITNNENNISQSLLN